MPDCGRCNAPCREGPIGFYCTNCRLVWPWPEQPDHPPEKEWKREDIEGQPIVDKRGYKRA